MMMNLKKWAFSSAENSPSLDLGLLILRLSFGLAMAFAHGLGKVPPSERFIEGVSSMGFPFPVFFAWSAGLSEFVGALLIAAGLLTRPSAVLLAGTMFVAAFIRHGADPFNQKELALLYFAFSLAFIFLGAGRFSLDAIIRKKI